MAYDLLFRRRTHRNWARGCESEPITDEVTFKLSDAEMAMLADVAATKMMADMGDRASIKKMGGVHKKVAQLRKKAKKGDPAAKRALLVLAKSGVFESVQSFTLGGWGAGEALVPHTSYRVAVMRQAHKLSGNGRPTTKHFFAAKKAVDGAMTDAGLSLFLPGARPGRITY